MTRQSFTPLDEAEYEHAWGEFENRFRFFPDYYDKTRNAITEPHPSMVFDLDFDWPDAVIDEVDNSFRSAYQSLVPADDYMYALDWQHTSYQYRPHVDVTRPPWVFPDGDYIISVSRDFSFGTFGHPWQRSLTVFGAALLAELAQRPPLPLTIIRQTPPTRSNPWLATRRLAEASLRAKHQRPDKNR